MQQKKKLASITCAVLLATAMLSVPSAARAQQAALGPDDGAYGVGSVILTILNLPFKAVTCLGTQAITLTAYVLTNGVEGNYEGGTNGKQIGEVARGACVGHWVIKPEQVKKDYE